MAQINKTVAIQERKELVGNSMPVDNISETLICEQVSRILTSSLFLASARMIRFLRFVVEEAVTGHIQEIKETTIGVQVFDRPPSYDPRIDPIVRVEARRLRQKLQAYYDGPGKEDALLIELPKGKYSPTFQIRNGGQEHTQSKILQNEITIALLPFTYIGPERRDAFFCQGLREELILVLTDVAGLHIVAIDPLASAGNDQENTRIIIAQQYAKYILHGSVRRSNQRLRITAHLIETATSYHLWSEAYDYAGQDMFVVQQEVAARVGTMLRYYLRSKSGSYSVTSKLQAVDCMKLCLQARALSQERTAEGLRRSIVVLEQAIRADPSSASAYAGLATTYTLLAEYGLADGEATVVNARNSAEKALALDPSSAEAHSAFGLLTAVYDWRWQQAGHAFERALALDPGYAPAHHWYAMNYLAMFGLLDQAEAEMKAALRLDRHSPLMLHCKAFLNVLCQDYDQSIEICKLLLEQDPSLYKAYTSMGRAYLQKGDYGKAIELLKIGRSLAGDVPTILGALGQAQGMAGYMADANQSLAELSELATHLAVPCTCFALIYLGLGDLESAMDWLELGIERHQSSVLAMKVHPAYLELRGEPRFSELVHRIGLSEVPYGKVLP